jgi:hypothetical protein
MKPLVVLGLMTGLLAGFAVCIVSDRQPPQLPGSEGVPEAVRPPLDLPLPGNLRAAVSDRKSPATAPPLSRSDDEKSHQLQLEIERALVSIDDVERDRAYTQLLPALIAIDPVAVERLVECCPAGLVREQLLRHAALVWSAANLDGAIRWVTAMKDDGERDIAATEIVSQVAQADPGHAIEVSDLFGIGRKDGTVEHIAQLWAAENLKASLRWVEAQPPGAQRDQLLARIIDVQAQTAPADAASTVLNQISPGPMQDAAVASVVRQWSIQDADAAAAWVEELPNGRDLQMRLLRVEYQ